MFFWRVRDNGDNTLSKKHLFILAIILVFLIPLANSEEEAVVVEDKKSKEVILAKLEEAKSLAMVDFIERMSQINNEIDEYINIKEQECSGEYTSFTINEQGDKVFQKNKLTNKEKKLCKYLLINFQIEVTKKSFEIRKIYLKRTHEDQFQKLSDLEKKRLSELESTANKYK